MRISPFSVIEYNQGSDFRWIKNGVEKLFDFHAVLPWRQGGHFIQLVANERGIGPDRAAEERCGAHPGSSRLFAVCKITLLSGLFFLSCKATLIALTLLIVAREYNRSGMRLDQPAEEQEIVNVSVPRLVSPAAVVDHSIVPENSQQAHCNFALSVNGRPTRGCTISFSSWQEARDEVARQRNIDLTQYDLQFIVRGASVNFARPISAYALQNVEQAWYKLVPKPPAVLA